MESYIEHIGEVVDDTRYQIKALGLRYKENFNFADDPERLSFTLINGNDEEMPNDVVIYGDHVYSVFSIEDNANDNYFILIGPVGPGIPSVVYIDDEQNTLSLARDLLSKDASESQQAIGYIISMIEKYGCPVPLME